MEVSRNKSARKRSVTKPNAKKNTGKEANSGTTTAGMNETTPVVEETAEELELNAQLVQLSADTAEIVFHPGSEELRPGEWLECIEPNGEGLALQVIGVSTATYPGAAEAALQQVLESAASYKNVLIMREEGMIDLKRVKLAKAKVRRRVRNGRWLPWNGWITTRNVRLRRVPLAELIARVSSESDKKITIGTLEHADSAQSALFGFDARLIDKLSIVAGNKGHGKSHLSKLIAGGLMRLHAPCIVFDINNEYTTLPGAQVARIGGGYTLALHEVGFPTLMSVIDAVFPMTETARANLDHHGPRFMAEQVRTHRFATIEYLIDKAEAGDFGGGEMVARAITERLQKVRSLSLFASGRPTTSLWATLQNIGERGGILVFDLSALRPRIQKGVAAGINRILENFCENEKKNGTKRYPFVFYEEAHLYVDADDLMNIVTRMRHLGMTTVFVTNRPGMLPEAVMSLADNLFLLNLGSHPDVRAISKSVLTDSETLEHFAITLPPHYALVTGAVTGRLPLVVHIAPLPSDIPASGVTQSFWDRPAA